MTGAERSLLAFLDAPVVVGDPDGCAVYVNPAFEARFETSREEITGRSLAELFEGGGREAVLQAVARVYSGGESVRFRVRERGVGYAAVASAIVAEDARVGVVILLKEEVDAVERLLALNREVQDPIAELTACLEALIGETGGRRSERFRVLVEDGMRAVGRLRKWSDEVGSVLGGAVAAETRSCDPAPALRRLAERCAREAEPRQVAFLLMAPPSLPPASADPDDLESVLLKMVQRRLAQDPAPARITLSARVVGGREAKGILISVTERFRGGAPPDGSMDPAVIQEAVASLGAELHTTKDPQLGRTTLLRLASASA